MSDLTRDQVWEQIETLRAQYALSIAENLEIIKDARAQIAKARKLADELPVLKTRRKKPAAELPVHLTQPVLEGVITNVEYSGEKLNAKLDQLAAGELPQTMLIRDDI